MYIFHYCKQINDYLFDEKIDSNQKQVIIDKYNLQKIGKIKVYWENNVKITSFNNDLSFEYIDDKSITYDSEKDILIEEYESEICPNYNFYKVNIEEEFILYENKVDDIIIKMKVYDDYNTIEYHSDRNIDELIYEIIERIK